MFKIGIIGTENSHAGAFMEIFKTDPAYADMQVVCVGGMYEESNKALQEKYGVEIINDVEEMVKKVDAAMITCRDGKYHAGYAIPFVKAGKPVFVDKPFTVDIDEAKNLVALAKEKGVPIVGGSSVKSAYDVLMLENAVKTAPETVRGGTLVAPVNMNNEYGGFFFYSSHLAEMCLRIFGYDPIAVTAKAFGRNVAALVEYEKYTVSLQYVGDSYVYFGQIVNNSGVYARNIDISLIYRHECEDFANMLRHGKMAHSFEQLIAPVYLMNAIHQSYTTGQRVVVEKE